MYHVTEVQKLIEESVCHYDVLHKEMYGLPWRASRLTNRLSLLKNEGLLPHGGGGRHSKKLNAEQVALILIASLIGVCEPEALAGKVRLYASLKQAGDGLRIPLLRRLEIALADPQEAAKIDRFYLESTYPYAFFDIGKDREMYTIDGDETKTPPVTGNGQGAYLGHSLLVTLALGPVPCGWVNG